MTSSLWLPRQCEYGILSTTYRHLLIIRKIITSPPKKGPLIVHVYKIVMMLSSLRIH